MTVSFVHQNAVMGVQGGIERYIATLLAQGGNDCVLVCAQSPQYTPNILGLHLSLPTRFPQWLRFVVAVWVHARKVAAFLRAHHVNVLEFSRPEYVFFSFLFAGKKVFTLHGTGPARTEPGKYLLHHIACCFLPLLADEIRVVGRDASGLPAFVRRLMADRISTIDAWYDPCFTPAPFPAPTPLQIFYAGRLAEMKNPKLLFALIRAMKKEHGDTVAFHYFGGDGADLPQDIRNTHITDHGLLSASDLAQAIQTCHMGILCSNFGEGSPFIIVETLACGRGYVLPPLSGLQETYANHAGIVFAKEYTTEEFTQQIIALADKLRRHLTPTQIAQSVEAQAQARAAQTLIDRLQAE